MNRSIIVLGAAVSLAGCGQQAQQESNAANTAAAAPAKKHPTYCFFKDADTKGWAASRGADGSIAVNGKVRIEDRRYMGSLSDFDVSGSTAQIWLTMAPNNTGSGVLENWWDVGGTIPGAAAADKVSVMCGKKTIAELPLKKG
jgi:hypothetical protein